jgi:threonine aldolase
VLAAAGVYALEHHIDRLAEDHANARALAEGLGATEGLTVEPPQTNMVFVHLPPARIAALQAHLAAAGVKALLGPRTRLVTHLDLSARQVTDTVALFQEFFAGAALARAA